MAGSRLHTIDLHMNQSSFISLMYLYIHTYILTCEYIPVSFILAIRLRYLHVYLCTCAFLTLGACARGLGLSVCWSVCLSVCLLSHISPLECLFVLKTLWATKVKKFVGFSLKLLRCRDPALPSSYGHTYRRPFFTHVCYTSCARSGCYLCVTCPIDYVT